MEQIRLYFKTLNMMQIVCEQNNTSKRKHEEECAVIQATEGRVHLFNSLALQNTFPKKKISDVEKESE